MLLSFPSGFYATEYPKESGLEKTLTEEKKEQMRRKMLRNNVKFYLFFFA